jgi:hypothetical protein
VSRSAAAPRAASGGAEIAAWGSGANSDALRHVACGTMLEARWYCPTCARAIAEDGASSLRHA